MASYSIRRFHSDGSLLDVKLAVESVTALRKVNNVGPLMFTAPYTEGLLNSVYKNQVMTLWRNGICQFDTQYLVQDWAVYSDTRGLRKISVEAVDLNWVLKSRIIAYAAASAQSEKYGASDDIMKAIVRENLGTLASNTERSLSNLTVDEDYSEGETIDKAFSWRNVLAVLQEISEQSLNTEKPIYFDLHGSTPPDIRFDTYLSQLGTNHGWSSGDVRLVGEAYGNLKEAKVTWLNRDEVTSVYAGGQGEEDDRLIVHVEDENRIWNNVPYNRIERFADARNSEEEDLVLTDAQTALKEGEPKRLVSGRITETDGMKYDRDYRFGDVVAVEAFGTHVDCQIVSVGINATSKGESLDIRLEGIIEP